MNFFRFTVCLLVCAAATAIVDDSIASAQRPSSSRHSLVVDEVTLADGKRLYGIVVKRDAQSGVELIVEREWLKTTYPKLYTVHFEAELKSDIEGYTKHLFRLEAWWKSRIDDVELVGKIDEEMERIEKLRTERKAKGAADVKFFTTLNYASDEVQNVFVQSLEHHKIAGVAWKHKIKRVSSRNVKAIKRDLESLNVDWRQETFDLSAELPGRSDQSESEWNARVAIYEYRFRKQLEFQGVGSNLIRVERNKPADQLVDIQVLMGQFAGSGLGGLGGGSELSELLDELGFGDPTKKKPQTDWWAKGTKIAAAEGVTGFVVKRLIQSPLQSNVSVECCFIVQTSPGKWIQACCLTGTSDRNHVDQADIDRLKNDPQIKRVMAIASTMGLDSNDTIDQAIRHGAATEKAMSLANEKFAEFIFKFTQQTDAPIFVLANE